MALASPRPLLDDLRYAARSLAHSRGYALATVLLLALGVGANTAMFSLVDAVLFRRLAVERSEELLRVYASGAGSERGALSEISYPAYADFRDQATAFAGLAGYRDNVPLHLAAAGAAPERVEGAVVTGNYFGVLGVRPRVGRLLAPDDDRAPGAHPVAVLSERLWRARFAARPNVAGTVVRLNAVPFTVVGVAPAGFRGVSVEQAPDVWVSTAMVDDALPDLRELKPLERRGFRWLHVVGRLRPGATAEQARAQLTTIVARRRAEERAAAAGAAPADQKEVDVRHPLPAVLPADDALLGAERAGRARRLSWTLLGVVALVLMVACADAAGLLLARAERRRRELAIRVAVGASRARIVRQMLLEGALLAVGGAAAGVVLAMWLTDFVVASVPRDFAIPLGSATAVLAGRSLAFTMLAAAATALLFSTVPALRASRTDPAGVLKGAAPARAAAGARRGWRALGAPPLRGSLVVLQVALSAVLLVGAGLLLRTLANARGVPLGFDPAHAATGTVDLSRQGYDRERQRAFQSALLARLAAAPGVRAVALAASVPVSGPAFRNSAELEGYTPPPGEEPMVAVNVVSPGYFRAVGTPLLRGRDFTAADDARDAPPVVIVNQALADRYWPGQDAVGKRVLNIGKDGAMIVGVVADARHISLRDAPEPMVILPLGRFGASRLTVVARAAGGGAEAAAEGAMLRAIREAVAALDRDLPLLDMRSMRERVGVAVAQERLLAMLLSAFATLALVLSAAGLYGVVSYTAASRTREWGVRIALGARPRDVLLLVQRQGAALAAIGLAIGLAGALALSRVLGALLYEVAPDDALTYAAVGALLAAVSLLAAYVPARRATRVNPVDAMRSE